MKKIIALFSVFVMVICMSSCSSSRAAKKSSETYKVIETAFSSVDEFAETISKAWYQGINFSDNLIGKKVEKDYFYKYYYTTDTVYDYSEGMRYMADKTGISLDDLKKGIAYERYGEDYADYVSVSDSSKMEDVYKSVLDSYSSDGSACIYIVISTYKATGKYAVIEANLSSSKESVKKIIEKYPEYVFVEDIKDYYITTQLYFDYFNNLAGLTYDEAVAKSNEYRSLANEYCYSLDLFLEAEKDKKEEKSKKELATTEEKTTITL